jgi:hypothetical protein
MSKYARRVDENQAQIVAALESVGCSVCDLSRVGGECLDLLVGRQGRNYFIEVKNPAKPKADQDLTAAQKRLVARWNGQHAIVRTVQEAWAVVGIVVSGASCEAVGPS